MKRILLLAVLMMILTGNILKDNTKSDEDGEATSEESFVFEDEETCEVPIDPEGALAFGDDQGGLPKTEEDSSEEKTEEKSEENTEEKSEETTAENAEEEKKDSISRDFEAPLTDEEMKADEEEEAPLKFPDEEVAREIKSNHDLISSLLKEAKVEADTAKRSKQ